MWGCQATPQQPTWQIQSGLDSRTGNKLVCLLAAAPKFNVHVHLFTQQTDFIWGGSWSDLPPRLGMNIEIMYFPEHTTAPVIPGSICDICADLVLFSTPPHWILVTKWVQGRKTDNPPGFRIVQNNEYCQSKIAVGEPATFQCLCLTRGVKQGKWTAFFSISQVFVIVCILVFIFEIELNKITFMSKLLSKTNHYFQDFMTENLSRMFKKFET